TVNKDSFSQFLRIPSIYFSLLASLSQAIFNAFNMTLLGSLKAESSNHDNNCSFAWMLLTPNPFSSQNWMTSATFISCSLSLSISLSVSSSFSNSSSPSVLSRDVTLTSFVFVSVSCFCFFLFRFCLFLFVFFVVGNFYFFLPLIFLLDPSLPHFDVSPNL